MLMILIQWCYFALASFLTGFAVVMPISRFCTGRAKEGGYRVRSGVSCMMAGLLVLNVYAEYFSLFGGVGLWANVPVILFCIGAGIVLRKPLAAFFAEKRAETDRGQWMLYGLLTLLFAYGSSRGYMHYDTGLYHAQAIRWIEEYGVVPGLANLHSRFGYNSAAFALCALFGGGGLMKYPMHCAAGFFALLCAVKCTGLLTLPKRKRVRVSDFLYAGCIFYLVAVFRELVSPASDYFAMLILFWVLMTWVELWETGEEEILPYGLLSLYLVYAATVKLSTAVLFVLAVYPAVRLLKEKKWKQTALFIGLGVGIALPYLIRNVIISGWLFYPFTFFDWFDVDWKISKGYADSDAKEIRAYAMEIFDVYQLDQPFSQWFPNWLNSQAALDRLLVLAGWAAVPVSMVLAGAGVWKGLGAWKKTGVHQAARENGGGPASGGQGEALGQNPAGMEPFRFALLQAAAVLGFFFWQFGAPLVRYGYFYVLFLPLAAFGGLYVVLQGCPGQKKKRCTALYRGFVGLLVAFLLYKGYNLIQMTAELGGQPYYIYQQDYADSPAETYEVDGVTIYVPTDRGQIGYSKFPSSPIVQDIELRDGTLESGFRQRSRSSGKESEG